MAVLAISEKNVYNFNNGVHVKTNKKILIKTWSSYFQHSKCNVCEVWLGFDKPPSHPIHPHM